MKKITILFLAINTFLQAQEIKKDTLNFKFSESLTNNGISFIPSFTLDKPASVSNLFLGGKRFSAEIELRYSLEGKPWAFVGQWKYKLINNKKFQQTVGMHLPALAFKQTTKIVDGVAEDAMAVNRFLPFEMNSNYIISKNVSAGLLMFYAKGLDFDTPQNTNFIALRAVISNIKLIDDFSLRFNPQVFLLRSDRLDGYYTAASLTLSKKNLPFSLSTMATKIIKSDILTKDFNWNITLTYDLSKKMVY